MTAMQVLLSGIWEVGFAARLEGYRDGLHEINTRRRIDYGKAVAEVGML